MFCAELLSVTVYPLNVALVSVPPVLPFSPLHGCVWEGPSPAGCFAAAHKNTWIWIRVSLLSSNPELGNRAAHLEPGCFTKGGDNQPCAVADEIPRTGMLWCFAPFAPCTTGDSAAPGTALPWQQRSNRMQES